MSQQCIVNTSLITPFTSAGLITGKVSFSNTYVLYNGLSNSLTFTTTEIGNGLYTLTITFPSIGEWAVFIEGQIYQYNVVAATLASTLQDLSDEALGSWQWNKLTGSLALLRKDGSSLANYSVTDTPNSASRELI